MPLRARRANRGPCLTLALHAFLMPMVSSQAQAQPDPKAAVATTATKPDPLDPKARVPALRYTSPLTQYRRLADDPPLAWREANDTVTRIGGWRAYAREAQMPDAAAAADAAAPHPADAALAVKNNEPARAAPAPHGSRKQP